MTPDQKKTSLQKYAASLKQRLSAPVPKKHEHRPDVLKSFLELDLKRTLAKIESLG